MKSQRRKPTPLATHLVLKVSATAGADPRTVRKLLRGERVSSMPHDRIVGALRELKLEHLIPQEPAAEVG